MRSLTTPAFLTRCKKHAVRTAARLIRSLRKTALYYKMRCTEIELQDKINASDLCRTDAERIDNSQSRRILQRELVHLRIQLAEFSPPGERKTFEVA